MFSKRLFGLAAVLILAAPVNAAEPLTGPVIGAYGPVYAVAGQTFNLELSAMTAHVRLQSEGYTLIPF